jgi:hypothetical protein
MARKSGSMRVLRMPANKKGGQKFISLLPFS